MEAQEAAFRIALLFLVLRGTRGLLGVPAVCDYTLGHWEVFLHDFASYCRGLGSHCVKMCKKCGSPVLSHNEGLHVKLSGIHFLRTLRNGKHREKLVGLAKKMKQVVSRLLRHRGRGVLAEREVIDFGEAVQGGMTLAIEQLGGTKPVVKKAWKYNAMNIV